MDSNIADYRVMLAKYLGPKNFSKYMETLRDMFGQKITKETFDGVVSTFLTGDALVLHNLMMLAILKMCGEDIKRAPVVEYEIKETKPLRLLEPKIEKVEIVPITFQEKPPMPIVVASNIIDVPIYKEPEEQKEISLPIVTIENRFPMEFVDDIAKRRQITGLPPDTIPDVTHLYEIDEHINENITMSDYFAPPKPGQPFTSHNSTYYGKCFLKAWSMGCPHVEISAIDAAADATYNHIKDIICAMVRQKKPYSRYQQNINSAFLRIGSSYPNPYLRQGHHAYETFSRPEILMCGEAMHVPDHISSTEEKERLAILRDAADCPTPEGTPFQRKTLTVSELYAAIKENPMLIPNSKHKTELTTKILGKLNSGGKLRPTIPPSYVTDRIKLNSGQIEEDLTDEEEGEILPTCSY